MVNGLEILISNASGLPIYEQITTQIKQKILSGELAAGEALARPLGQIFVGYDEGLFTLTCHAFRLFSFAFLFAGFNIFASSFFTALGNGLISAAISFLRTLVFQTSSVILLPLLLGVDGIWYAITAAEIFATIISLIFLLAKRKKYHYL